MGIDLTTCWVNRFTNGDKNVCYRFAGQYRWRSTARNAECFCKSRNARLLRTARSPLGRIRSHASENQARGANPMDAKEHRPMDCWWLSKLPLTWRATAMIRRPELLLQRPVWRPIARQTTIENLDRIAVPELGLAAENRVKPTRPLRLSFLWVVIRVITNGNDL